MKSISCHSTPSRVSEGIRRMQGVSADAVPTWRPEPYLNETLALLHVRGIGRLTEETEFPDIPRLLRSQRSIISALFGARSPWLFCVVGRPNNVSLFFGLPSGGDVLQSWRTPIQAAYPGCELSDRVDALALSAELSDLRWVARMTGNPSSGSGMEGSSRVEQNFPRAQFGQTESLLRAMQGMHWAYFVLLQPLHEHEITARISFLSTEEREITSAYLRRGTAEENNNPEARYYVELLQGAATKCRLGRTEGMWGCQVYLMGSGSAELARGAQSLMSAFSGADSHPEPVRVRPCTIGEQLTALLPPTALTTSEVAVLTRLPGEEFPGYRLIESVRFAVSPPIVGQDQRIAIGTILDQGCDTPNWFELGCDDLCKHTLVAGVSGAGKTHTCYYLLRQLWEEHGLPWLVLEPAMKSEYRRLMVSRVGSDLRIFTLGDESGVPYRFNPMEVIEGVHVQSHIDGLLSLFNAAFAWVPPMPDVLSLAIHELYTNMGWDLARGHFAGKDRSVAQPTLSDLIHCVDSIVPTLGYDAEITGNIRAGLRTRLSNLTLGGKGLLLNSGVSLSMDYLLAKPAILELAAIGNDEEKSFLLGALLLAISEYRQTSGLSNGRLRHVTLIEEAHRLLRRAAETVGTEVANPRAKAVEAFCNLLAEVRAYGEGIIVVDQIPARLAPDVVKNTNLKIVHRLVAEDDRRLVGDAMSLNDRQMRFLAALPSGQTVVYSESRESSYLVRVPDHARHHGFADANPGKADVVAHMRGRVPSFAASNAGHAAKTARQSQPRPAERLLCAGCQQADCSYRDGALEALLSRDHSSAFRAAIEKGWPGLWSFGGSIVCDHMPPERRSPQAVFCLLMNLASIFKFSTDQIVLMQRELSRIRDWEENNTSKGRSHV